MPNLLNYMPPIHLAAIALALASTAPIAPAADTGVITGTIDQPNAVTALIAIDRANDKKYPGRIDANSGRFTIQGLPTDTAFDLIVDAGPIRLEGMNLNVPRSDFEEEQPLTEADRKKLDKEVRRLDKFMDKIDVLAITGNVQHAAILMNKLRTTPFYMSKEGEIIWRLELWRFHKPDETWIKAQDDLFLTVYRVRIMKTEYDKKVLTLDPALGGIRVPAKDPKTDVGKIVLPGKEPGIKFRKENLKEVVVQPTDN